jgi:small subunit ribosomal protein S3
VVIAGKLTGQRHRTEKFKDGYIKFCGEPKIQFIEHGFAVAKLKQGVIGVTVEIMAPGAVLPADIMVLSRTDAARNLPDLYEADEEEEVMEAPLPESMEKDETDGEASEGGQ